MDSFPLPSPVKKAQDAFSQLPIFAGYSKEEQPLGAYAALMGIFGAFVAGLSGAMFLSGSKLPERQSPGDLLLLGVAAHKAARLVTKDRVTAPLRAAFVEYQKGAGEGEVEEEPRGTGMQEAVGDLLTCPYCVAVWIVTPLWFGMALAPRLTRFVAGILATVTISDFMQRVYLKAKNWGDS